MSEEKELERERNIDRLTACFFWLCVSITSAWSAFLVCLVLYFIGK